MGAMRISRVVISILMICLLIVIYPIFMTYIKDEDFIGTYYSVNIKPDIVLEICGTGRGIIDQNKDKVIISDLDSMIVVDDAIYGICNNKFFLFTISNGNVVYSSTPMSHFSTYKLLSPIEYYKKSTMYIDIICDVVLIVLIIFILRMGFKKQRITRQSIKESQSHESQVFD